MIRELTAFLGEDCIISDSDRIAEEARNTLGLIRNITAIVYPATTEQILEIVKLANEFKQPLYPVSRGKNLGYGDKLPVTDNQLIVDLSRMNAIRDYSRRFGFVEIEPGVTQEQLYGFLKEKKAPYWMDATGAGLQTSIIGNTLEGGFGHTPRGNRRDTVSDYEIVLGNGTLLKTGTFPGLGPDLKSMFVQSNFGIVTAARIELMPEPECFESFVVSVSEESRLEQLIDMLDSLRQAGTLQSLVHVANAVRALMTTEKFPAEYADQTISQEIARHLLSSPALKVGLWSAIGGLYGTRREVNAAKKQIKRQLGSIFDLRFFNDSRIRLLKNITGSGLFGRYKTAQKIHRSISAFSHTHQLMKGVPSDEPLKNIKWRIETEECLGLVWFSPAIPASGKNVREAIEIANELFCKHRFEMPCTVTLVKPGSAVMVFSINFDLCSDEETERAHLLYDELKDRLGRNGMHPYRSAILGMENISYREPGKNETFRNIKSALDPNSIISPRRYGI